MSQSVLFLYVLAIHMAICDIICPTTNNHYPSTVCPSTSLGCCKHQFSNNGYGCKMVQVDNQSETYCCSPGPLLNASVNLPNVMIMGDSVSIGYSPAVAANLSGSALVQHSPWDTRDGGTCNTSYGLSCFPIFMVGVRRQFMDWDLIQFNFGLHDLDNSSSAEAIYGNQLRQITEQLMEYNNGKAKLQYADTTPLMNAYNEGNHVVEEDNKIAENIMNNYSIPIVSLYETIVDICGPVPYVNCSICRKEPCSFHYNPVGYKDLSVPVIHEIRKQLNL